MNLAVAIPLGVAAAVAYGVAAAFQHDAVGQHEPGSTAPPFSALLRDPRWLAASSGDVVGLVLQLAALATGPVVLIQPLFVLCLPVALPIRAMFGGTAPGGPTTSRRWPSHSGWRGSLRSRGRHTRPRSCTRARRC